MSAEKYLTEGQLATRWGVSTKILQTYRQNGIGPSYLKLHDGPKAPVRYPMSEIIHYEHNHMVFTYNGKRKINPPQPKNECAVSELECLMQSIKDRADHILERDVINEIIEGLDEEKRRAIIKWLPDFDFASSSGEDA